MKHPPFPFHITKITHSHYIYQALHAPSFSTITKTIWAHTSIYTMSNIPSHIMVLEVKSTRHGIHFWQGKRSHTVQVYSTVVYNRHHSSNIYTLIATLSAFTVTDSKLTWKNSNHTYYIHIYLSKTCITYCQQFPIKLHTCETGRHLFQSYQTTIYTIHMYITGETPLMWTKYNIKYKIGDQFSRTPFIYAPSSISVFVHIQQGDNIHMY